MQRFSAAVAAAIGLAVAAPHAQPPALPSPESVLGYQVGADFHLATYDEALTYFQKLAQASDRITLLKVEGQTSYGRDWYFAVISSRENLQNLEKYRRIAQRLAHPQGLTDEQARQLAAEGKPIVHIDGGLHATEVAGPQHTLQLAYDILSRAEEPKTRTILDHVILMLWPTINPDGQNIVANWYRANVGTPYEISPPPELYQKYVGHDNNRDAYMLNMIESREIARTWREWEPQIIYVHHQTAPFPTRIWLPPFAEPIGSRVPPLMSRTVNAIGMAIAQGLESRGQVGATHMGTGFDAWYPGYIDYMPMFQNINAFWTETALYRYATPHFYALSDFPRDMRDLRSQSLYPSPWKGGWWRLRDAVDYMITASLSVLDYASKYHEELLYNRYQAGRDRIRTYEHEPPYAYLIAQQQHDRVAPVELLRRLAFNGVRVSQLTAAATHDGVSYPAGTWVIPMDQEFAGLARELLEPQHYPDLRESPDGPLEQPYDVAGWTLPYQMDVRVTEARVPLTVEFVRAMKPLVDGEENADAPGAAFDSVPGPGFDVSPLARAIVPPDGQVSGAGPALAIDPAQNNAFRAINDAWSSGATVRFAQGRYVIEGAPASFVQNEVRTLALEAERVPAGGGVVLKRPRLAVYQPWSASMDEGWTRWVLEQYGFTFATLHNMDVQSGALRDRFDAIVIADESARTLMDGLARGSVPPQYEGGLGAEGVRALDQFVRAGGTLVCLNSSAAFVIEQLHLPVKNAVANLKRQQFFVGGSLLQVTIEPGHPVMAGMPERPAVFFDDGPVFAPGEGFNGAVLARYQKTGSPLLSGYLLGESYLNGMAAALDVTLEDGHVILIGFRPQWRGQPFGTFRVLFNAVATATSKASKKSARASKSQ
jgi:hypothetical protein